MRFPPTAAEALEGTLQPRAAGPRVHGADADRRLPRHVRSLHIGRSLHKSCLCSWCSFLFCFVFFVFFSDKIYSRHKNKNKMRTKNTDIHINTTSKFKSLITDLPMASRSALRTVAKTVMSEADDGPHFKMDSPPSPR